jgi:pimeloyl-ACP methyl ester carboxylesterase
VNSSVQEKIGVQWLKKKIKESGTEEEKKIIPKMEKNNNADRHLLMKYGGAVHNIKPERLGKIMKNSPYSPEKYTLELYKKGPLFAEQIFQEGKKIDFLSTPQQFKIPVYLFLGRYDYVTPTKPVMVFFETMKAPSKEILWFEKSGHHLDVEEPVKFQNKIRDIIQKNLSDDA